MPFLWFIFGAGLTAGVVYLAKREDAPPSKTPTDGVYTLKPGEIWQLFATLHMLQPWSSGTKHDLETPLLAVFGKMGLKVEDGGNYPGGKQNQIVIGVTVPAPVQLKVGTVIPIVGSPWADSVTIDQIVQAPASVPPSGNVSAANFP